MKKSLFRKRALEKLQSPEHLDQLLRVTSPRRWLALIVLWVLLGAAGLWGVYGRVATKVAGTGIFILPGGVLEVVSLGTGRVQQLNAKPGEKIREGDTVAVLVNPEMEKRLLAAKAELAERRSDRDVTIDLIVKETDALQRGLKSERNSIEKKKGFLKDRRGWLEMRVEAYEKLSKEGAVARQQVYDVQWQLDQALIALNQAEQELIDLTSKAAKVLESKETRLVQEQFKVQNAERNVTVLEEQMRESSRVDSAIDGLVLSVRTSKGKVVHQGDPLLSVEPDGGDLGFHFYVPALQGKRVKPGMDVQITPSTVKRDEYGFMIGKVAEVGMYPAASEGMMSVLNNADLVRSLLGNGPVIAVKAVLVTDPSTSSGFKWSSIKGAEVQVHSGTLGSAQTVVREQPPITLVIPVLKHFLGM